MATSPQNQPTASGTGGPYARAVRAEPTPGAYEEVFQKAPIPCLIVNCQTLEIMDANDASCRDYGYTRAELRAMRFGQLVAPEDRERIPLFSDKVASAADLLRARSHWAMVSREGRPLGVAVGGRTLDFAGVRCYIVHGTDKWAGPGPVPPLASLSPDREKSLQQFAFSAFHDLKEPLHMIRGYLGLIQQENVTLSPDAKQYLHFAVQGADRLQALVHTLLDYFRVEIKDQVIQAVNLNDVLAEAAENLRLNIREAAVHITYDELPTVPGDRIQLVRLYQNLLSNAIKFRKGTDAQVFCGARVEAPGWHLWVQDNGVGVPPEERTAIFEPFHRLKSADDVPGTGLGLSICKRVVELHGGRIWVEETEGGGTTVHFTISRGG